MVNTLAKEKAYLHQVYQALSMAKSEAEQLLQQAKSEGQSSLANINEGIRLNFDNYLDNLDTFSMIEQKNREIDQLNLRIKTAEKLLKKIDLLLQFPYFGKITVDFLEGDSIEDFYIGVNGFTDKKNDNLVYDWRSPIAELFYSNAVGETSYVVNQNEINVVLAGRRQFLIEKDHLLKYFDTEIAIQDPLLLEALEQDTTQKMKNITATIQQEQNQIIRDTSHPIVLVNGIAGSGKTSTVMQRIAYLLYLKKEEISASNFLILSPNQRFIHYISEVLPSLGEQNPANRTLLQFISEHLGEKLEDEESYFERISAKIVDPQASIIRSRKFAEYIRDIAAEFTEIQPFFTDIVYKGKVLVAKETMTELYQKTPVDSSLHDRVQATKRQLLTRWESRLDKQAQSAAIQDQLLSLSEELQQKYFGHLISDDSKETLAVYGKKLLKKKYRKVTKALEQNSWLNTKVFFEKLYFDFTQTKYQFPPSKELTLDEATALLFIRTTCIEKIDLFNLKHLLIDEVQDYTAAQLVLLTELFPKSNWTVVGDENQAIFNCGITFNEIGKIVANMNRLVKHYDLYNSYRSSGAITAVFQQIADEASRLSIVAIRSNGQQPQFFQINTQTEFEQRLQKLIHSLNGSKLTVITKTAVEAKKILERLPLIIEEKSAVDVLPISLAKGLEFDQVLIYNASAKNYVSQRDRKILYTAVSRAMEQLFISYEGIPSVFFEKS